jgi:hypothetical protein
VLCARGVSSGSATPNAGSADKHANGGPKDGSSDITVLMIVVLAFLSLIGFSIEGGIAMIAALSIHLAAHIVVELFARRAESIAVFVFQQM